MVKVIEDAKIFLHSFQSWSVRHSRREANSVAHVVAKNAIIRSLDQVWVGECPSFIHSYVLAENLFDL